MHHDSNWPNKKVCWLTNLESQSNVGEAFRVGKPRGKIMWSRTRFFSHWSALPFLISASFWAYSSLLLSDFKMVVNSYWGYILPHNIQPEQWTYFSRSFQQTSPVTCQYIWIGSHASSEANYMTNIRDFPVGLD